MESQNRLMVTLVACLVLTAVWMFFFAPKPPTTKPSTAAQAQKTETTKKAPPPKPSPTASAKGAAPAPPPSNLPKKTVAVDLSKVHYGVTSEGGGLDSAVLEGEKMRAQVPVSFTQAWERLFGAKEKIAPQMNMAQPVKGQPPPLAVSIDGDHPLSGLTRYEVSKSNGKTVTMHAAQNGWDVSKKLSWGTGPYTFGYDVTLTNTGKATRKAELAIHYPRSIDPKKEVEPSMFGGIGNISKPACYVKDDMEDMSPSDKPPKGYSGPIQFFGINQQYFLSAIYSLDGAQPGRCVLTAKPTYRDAVAYFPVTLKPGQSVTRHFGVYVGPKDLNRLRAVTERVSRNQHMALKSAPPLEKAVDFGFFGIISKVLLVILRAFYAVVPNWGVAIIFLTILIKLLLVPVTHKSMMSQEAMKRLSPKVEAIKKKYKGDKEKIQMETMRLYQQEKVNPFGSCLMMLVQLPVWWALYRMLENSFELYRAPFFGPLWTDLTFKDPTYLIPILLGISQIFASKAQPQPMMEGAQAKVMLYVMPLFFTVIMLNYPLGLTLYIFANNVLTVGQQYGLRRFIDRKAAIGGPALEKRK